MLHKFGQLMMTKTRPRKHIYHDIEIPRPKNHDNDISRPKNRDIEIPRLNNCDIKIRGLKHHDIEKRRQTSHDIVISRFFANSVLNKDRFAIPCSISRPRGVVLCI